MCTVLLFSRWLPRRLSMQECTSSTCHAIALHDRPWVGTVKIAFPERSAIPKSLPSGFSMSDFALQSGPGDGVSSDSVSGTAP